MKLTTEIAREITAYIRSGTFPLVAAEGVGVPAEVFLDWMARGGKQRAREPYRTFAREVRRAAALSRLLAESQAYKKDPRFWLSHGPGRDRPNYPGWAGEIRPNSTDGPVPEQQDWGAVCVCLMQALAEFPEARAAAALALQEMKTKRGSS
jgi:hypothetical protein